MTKKKRKRGRDPGAMAQKDIRAKEAAKYRAAKPGVPAGVNQKLKDTGWGDALRHRLPGSFENGKRR